MRLAVRADGYAYSPEGVRYWRDSEGRWLRVASVHVETVKHFSCWPSFLGNKPVTRIAYRYGGENRVYVTEYVKDDAA